MWRHAPGDSSISRKCCSLTLMFNEDYHRAAGMDSVWARTQWRRAEPRTPAMELTFILSAAIFTLLAIVVATSLLNGSTSSADFSSARRYFGSGSEQPKQNGHVPDTSKKTKTKQKVQDDWCDLSGSSHDHWDVVKSVQSVSQVCLHTHTHTAIEKG